MIGELNKTNQQLTESEGTPSEDVIVPILMQLDILAMKGKTIRGVDYGMKKDTLCSSIYASTFNPTNAELMRYIVLLEDQLASLEVERQPPTHEVVDEEGYEDEHLNVL